MRPASEISGSGLWAVVPAAGYSSRMRAYKPLLPLGETTIIGQVISLLRGSGVEGIIVVTGHNHDLLAPAVEAAGARPVFNPDHDLGMFSSIRTGVRELSGGCRGFFLLPADIPVIRPATLNVIRNAFDLNPEAIVVPEFSGEPGHPPLIPAALVPVILAAGPEGNLRDILFSGSGSVKAQPSISLPVTDRGILMDADLPGDYDRVVERFRRLDIPDPEECRAVMDLAGCAPDLRAHMELVAQTALKLYGAVNPAFPGPDAGLNSDLIRAGALLHDVCRSEPDHARAGGEFLLSLGFPGVAEIVGGHMDLEQSLEKDLPDPGFTEKELVFLADKLCRGTCLELTYDRRFLQKAETYPHARERILNRLETARHIQSRIESAAGRSLGDILR